MKKKFYTIVIACFALGMIGLCGCGNAEKGSNNSSAMSDMWAERVSVDETDMNNILEEETSDVPETTEETEKENNYSDSTSNIESFQSKPDDNNVEDSQQTVSTKKDTDTEESNLSSSKPEMPSTNNTESPSAGENNNTESSEPTSSEIMSLPIHKVVNYYGASGFFTTETNIVKIDLVAYGLAEDNSSVVLLATEYYDVDTGTPIRFACKFDEKAYYIESVVEKYNSIPVKIN